MMAQRTATCGIMGHNDLDYERKTNRDLSSTFSSEAQNQLILQALLWLGPPAGP